MKNACLHEFLKQSHTHSCRTGLIYLTEKHVAKAQNQINSARMVVVVNWTWTEPRRNMIHKIVI
jgi:hypothetical protein